MSRAWLTIKLKTTPPRVTEVENALLLGSLHVNCSESLRLNCLTLSLLAQIRNKDVGSKHTSFPPKLMSSESISLFETSVAEPKLTRFVSRKSNLEAQNAHHIAIFQITGLFWLRNRSLTVGVSGIVETLGTYGLFQRGSNTGSISTFAFIPIMASIDSRSELSAQSTTRNIRTFVASWYSLPEWQGEQKKTKLRKHDALPGRACWDCVEHKKEGSQYGIQVFIRAGGQPTVRVPQPNELWSAKQG